MTLFALAYERATRLARQNPTGKWLRVQALEEIMKELERDFGTWRVAWGEVNRLQRIQSGGELETFSDDKLSLPIPGAPGWLGVVYNFYTRPEKGQKRRYGVAGNSFVSVIEFGPQVRARSHMVFGQNSDTSSTNHIDQSHLYSKKEYKPAWFSQAEIKANSRVIYSPGQKKQRKAA
jgi:acyl-homoserine lactone acylase PvdQ